MKFFLILYQFKFVIFCWADLDNTIDMFLMEEK